MTAIDKIQSFYNEYQAKHNKLKTKLDETITKINELEMEIGYVKSVELPKASETRLLNDDAAMEIKTKKKLEKLQNEHKEKEEDLVILQQTIHRLKVDSANTVSELERKLFRTEKQLNNKEVFDRMLQHRKAYLTALEKETKGFKSFQNADLLIQNIKANGGKPTSSTGTEIPYNVDLTVQHNEVVKIVKEL